MPNNALRWATTGSQVEPPTLKKDAGFKEGKPEAAQYANWLFAHVAAGANLDRDEDCLLRMPLLNSLSLSKGLSSVTFSRATVATYVDRYGVVHTAAIDEPRFETEGTLLEGASTNKVLWAQELGHAGWTLFNATLSADAIAAPDGTVTADKLIPSVAATTGRTVTSPVPSVGAIAYSFHVKAAEFTNCRIEIFSTEDGSARADVDLTDGTVSGLAGSPVIVVTTLADGWYRIKLLKTITGVTSFQAQCRQASSDIGDGIKGIYFWGAQIEDLAFASSYIKTEGTTVTRAADICNVVALGNILLQAQSSTIIFDLDILGTSAGSTQTAFDLGESSRAFRAVHFGGFPRYLHGDKQITEGLQFESRLVQRVGCRYDADTNVATLWRDGVERQAQIPTDVTDALGANIALGGGLYGHISNFRIYDRALSDLEMAVA